MCNCACVCVLCVRACVRACIIKYNKMHRTKEYVSPLSVWNCQQRQQWSEGRPILEERTTNEQDKLPIWRWRRHYFPLSSASWCLPRMRRSVLIVNLLISSLPMNFLVSHLMCWQQVVVSVTLHREPGVSCHTACLLQSLYMACTRARGIATAVPVWQTSHQWQRPCYNRATAPIRIQHTPLWQAASMNNTTIPLWVIIWANA